MFSLSKGLGALLPLIFCLCHEVSAQVTVSGTVFDDSRTYVVPHVQVYSTSGGYTFTDSLGRYSIPTQAGDSVYFVYGGKRTISFAVEGIEQFWNFDISLGVPVDKKYKVLAPVTVFSPSYQQDSMENRLKYVEIFERNKPGIRPSVSPGGGVGMDLEALIGIFQFRKNKMHKAFRERLIDQEKENYVDYRFSPRIVSRITGLEGEHLKKYREIYRPTYEFTTLSNKVQFYTYILESSYEYKKMAGLK